jgi:hypothetical protein
MARTFLQLQDEVLAHHFSATRYRTRVASWINEALRKLVRTARIPSSIDEETVAVLSGSADVVLTDADYTFIEYLTIDGATVEQTPLYPMEASEYDAYGDIPTGTPTHYVLRGVEGVRLFPTPNQNFTLKVVKRAPATAFSGDSQTLVALGLPELEDFEDALVSYALWRAYDSEHDREMALHHKAQWAEDQARVRADLQSRDPNAVRQVEGMLTAPAGPQFRRP